MQNFGWSISIPPRVVHHSTVSGQQAALLTAGGMWVSLKEESEWHTIASTTVEFDRNLEWKEHYIFYALKIMIAGS